MRKWSASGCWCDWTNSTRCWRNTASRWTFIRLSILVLLGVIWCPKKGSGRPSHKESWRFSRSTQTDWSQLVAEEVAWSGPAVRKSSLASILSRMRAAGDLEKEGRRFFSPEAHRVGDQQSEKMPSNQDLDLSGLGPISTGKH